MIVVFDGVCNFCNGWVRFVIRRDRRRVFHFAAAQGRSGRQLMEAAGLRTDRLDTIVLVDGPRHYERSEAVLQVLQHLPRWRALATALRRLPQSWRDAAYDAFAQRRYRLFGQAAHCSVPEAGWRDRFLA